MAQWGLLDLVYFIWSTLTLRNYMKWHSLLLEMMGVWLSCTTTLTLGLLQPKTRLDYLPLRASLITNSVDLAKKTKCQLTVHSSKKDCTVSPWKNVVPKLVTSKEQILHNYPDVFDGIGRFPGSPYHIQLDPSITPKQTPCFSIPVHLKEAFKQ